MIISGAHFDRVLSVMVHFQTVQMMSITSLCFHQICEPFHLIGQRFNNLFAPPSFLIDRCVKFFDFPFQFFVPLSFAVDLKIQFSDFHFEFMDFPVGSRLPNRVLNFDFGFLSSQLLLQLQKKKFITIFITWLAPRAGKMKRILCSDWLSERARWAYLAHSEFLALFRQNRNSLV